MTQHVVGSGKDDFLSQILFLSPRIEYSELIDCVDYGYFFCLVEPRTLGRVI